MENGMVNATIGSATILAMCVTFFIAMILPIVGLIVYGLRNPKQGIVKAWFLGAAGFFITQIVVRMPLLSAISMLEGFVEFATEHYLLYAILLASSAGLFELVGRYIVAKILSKKLTFKKAFAAGLGHGGIEAMVIVGMGYVSNFVYVIMINTGAINAAIAQGEAMGVDVAPFYEAVSTLVNTPTSMFLLAGYERVLTMISHTAMSLLVCYFVWKKQDIKGLGICLLIHTLLDGVTGVVSGLASPYLGSVISQNASYVIIYVYLTAVAVASVFVIRKIKQSWSAETVCDVAVENVTVE